MVSLLSVLCVVMEINLVFSSTLSRLQSPWGLDEDEQSYGYRLCRPFEGFLPPAFWFKIAPKCRFLGSSAHVQSPINIDTLMVTDKCKFKVAYVNDDYFAGKFENNGHSAVYTISKDEMLIKGIPLDMSTDCEGPNDEREYVFQELHFHIGAEKTEDACVDYVAGPGEHSAGSEHSIDGKFHNGEMHLVHWKKDTGSYQNALQAPDGIVIITLFIDVNDQDYNDDLEMLLNDYVSKIAEVNKSVDANVNPKKIYPGTEFAYTYSGSWTTPTCDPVRYYIFKDPVGISKKGYGYLQQLETLERPLLSGFRFRGFTSGKSKAKLKEYGNRRPIQKDGYPSIHANWEIERQTTV